MSYGILYIGSIPGNFTENEVLAHFQQFSALASFTLITSNFRPSSAAHFGYLRVPQEDIPIIRSYQHFFGSQKIVCEEYLGDESTSNMRNSLRRRRIFVRNVKKNLSDQDLQTTFSRFGEVESAFVIKDHLTGKSRSFGYVTFKNEEPAFALVAQARLMIKGVPILIHAFEKSMDDTLEFIQAKADRNYQSYSSASSNSGPFEPSNNEPKCKPQASANHMSISPPQVRSSAFHNSLNISQPGYGMHSHPAYPVPQKFHSPNSSSRHMAAQVIRQQNSDTTLSNKTLSSKPSKNLRVNLQASGKMAGWQLLGVRKSAAVEGPHVKPTSKGYNHFEVNRTEGSCNLRFNRLVLTDRTILFGF